MNQREEFLQLVVGASWCLFWLVAFTLVPSLAHSHRFQQFWYNLKENLIDMNTKEILASAVVVMAVFGGIALTVQSCGKLPERCEEATLLIDIPNDTSNTMKRCDAGATVETQVLPGDKKLLVTCRCPKR